MGYRVTIDDQTWSTDDLTLDEACAIEEEVGRTWHSMEPVNSAKHARAILSTFLARKVGKTAARMRVGTMTIQDTLACIQEPEASADAPKAAVEANPPASPEASETSPPN